MTAHHFVPKSNIDGVEQIESNGVGFMVIANILAAQDVLFESEPPDVV